MDYLYHVTTDHDLHQIMGDGGDDLFYAELERRILMLINTADENDEFGYSSVRSCSKDYRLSRLDQNYFDWTETQNSSSLVPATILNLWRTNNHNVNGTGTGTGVFIPHMIKSKRKNKPRNKKSENGRAIYKAKVKAVANSS